jgi:hypothetical protein
MIVQKTYPTVFRFTVFFFVLLSTLFIILSCPLIEVIWYDYNPTIVKMFFYLCQLNYKSGVHVILFTDHL